MSSPTGWSTIAAQARRHQAKGAVPVLVCSALAGTTDALEALLAAAIEGGDVEAAVRDVQSLHASFADTHGVSLQVLEADLATLRRLALGASLLAEVSPRVRAEVLALGELMSTRLGRAVLNRMELSTHWLDARTAMRARPAAVASRHHLAAEVDFTADPALQQALAAHSCVITQGFIASDERGETCVLGRGGSDTSAAVLAGKLQAEVCEIWTDVPGMFTADPRTQPGARLLRELDYAEAMEIATTGAKVLHPRALAPVQAHGIEMHIRCTPKPELPGTRIAADAPSGPAQVKALSCRRGLVLVSMETLGMWQQVGFLADVFAVFRDHGLSVDTVSTSETNVTVTLDPTANTMPPEVMEALLADLSPHCHATLISACASVSLVGRGIRSILHRLAPALEQFEEQRVHLVSQAASDLNLTFVVDEDTASGLLAKLHSLLFAHRGADALLGPTWRELFAPATSDAPRVTTRPWWQVRRSELLDVARAGTPVYVYDAPTLVERATQLTSLRSISTALYAMKANAHPDVLRLFAEHGLGFECVSLGEVQRVHEVVGHGAQILYTPNFAPREEIEAALALPLTLTLDNLHPLQAWPELFSDREVFVRLDPGRGRGHHRKVRTAGAHSKFGVASDQLDALQTLTEACGCKVVGLHAHAGSGVLEATAWQQTASFLAHVAQRFDQVRVLDLGGGLGVPDRPGRGAFDLAALDDTLSAVVDAHPHLELWLEPGRFLVAEAGVLLARTTQLKRKGDLRYVGVDAGMHTLLRPALYGAYHHVVDLTQLDAPPTQTATVVGPICETGDVLARDRRLPDVTEGDVLLFDTAGAYGAAMANEYNLRGRPREHLLRRG
ncbi:MAG: bifunctional aspartate kinase/diaminopimelate decarboxylase [Myxococcales bacterium]|nr:bifunctional aspartate kinase/diaminopimelate decarboxylase [Myxococcales bacterium]